MTSPARAAYQQAIDSGDREIAPRAADDLGLLLATHRDSGPDAVDGAVAAFRYAAGSGHPRYAPKAAWMLGTLLSARGDLPGARAAFQRSVDTGPPDDAVSGSLGNALVLAGEYGDLTGAQRILQDVANSGHPVHAARARAELDRILAAHGDASAYQCALEAAWPDEPD